VTCTIAVSGKGGVGKTTLAAALVRCLAAERGQSVLAVDADPNSSLGLLLGAQVERTVADIREDVLEDRAGVAGGMSKPRQVEYLLRASVAEGRRFDLLVMGRPEGPGCYCAVNNLLRTFLDDAAAGYPFVVVDNEAGMEHLSRRTTNRVDDLLIVTEATALGVVTARRILDIARSLPIVVKRRLGVVSCLRGEPSAEVLRGLADAGLEVAFSLPYDAALYETAVRGGTIFDVPDTSPALRAVRDYVNRCVPGSCGVAASGREP
jgi:CO dehydrogenase maturation factor